MEQRQHRQQLQCGRGQKGDQPHDQDQDQDRKNVPDDVLVNGKLTSIGQSNMDDSQPLGSHKTTVADVARRHDDSTVDVEVRNEVNVMVMSTGKRRRGRPPKIQGTAIPPQQLQQRTDEDEEDVCFICFDGGSLVLCDRRGCPKAYHPACIKRDESFFRSKTKWNCGWHICTICQKTSHYMCYTCTYSLCKRCTRGADYLCVRENKGFCRTCMRTIMLIENISSADQEQVHVDFDDQTSWEYLFKVYWTCLKTKLSLTLDELTKAQNPLKRAELQKANSLWGGITSSYVKREFPEQLHHFNEKVSFQNCSDHSGRNDFKRPKTENQLDLNNNDTDINCNSGVTRGIEAALLNNNKIDHTQTSIRNDANVLFNSSDESLRSNECSRSSSWTPPLDASATKDEQAQSSLQVLEITKGAKPLVDQSEISGSLPLPSSSVRLSENPSVRVKEGHQSEKLGSGELNVNACSPKTLEDPSGVRKGNEKQGESLGGLHSSSGMTCVAHSVKTPEQNHQAPAYDLPNATPNHSQKESKGWAAENKQSVSSKAVVLDSGPSWSSASSIEAAKTLLDLFGDFDGDSLTAAQPSARECDSNVVSTSSPKHPEGVSDHVPTPSSGNDHVGGSDHMPTPTSGNDHLTPSSTQLGGSDNMPAPISGTDHLTPSTTHLGGSDAMPAPSSGNDHLTSSTTHLGGNDRMPASTSGDDHLTSSSTHLTIDTSGWQPIIPGTNEFCSLADDSVSDLLAEVEAMESFGVLPSPTSKMSCHGELTHGSDFNYFSPVEGFSLVPDPVKSDALSFTDYLQMPSPLPGTEEPLQLSNMHSQYIMTEQSRGIPQICPQQAVKNEPFHESYMPSKSALTEEPPGRSQMPAHASSVNKSIGISQSAVIDHQSSYSGRSYTSTSTVRDEKPNDAQVRMCKEGSEARHSSSTVGHGNACSNMQPFAPPAVFPWEAISDIQLPASSASSASWGNMKGNANVSHGVGQPTNINLGWRTGGINQQHSTTNSVNWNAGGWGNQPKHHGDRYSGSRDHSNHFPARYSSVGRDRSSSIRQPYHGSGNGGGSYRTSPKGQRVCKFYESGHCKKGASCSYWHP